VGLVFACQPQVSWNGTAVEPVVNAPELVGTNWNGEPFALSDLEGKVAVVSFGYTFCPDVCPFTLFKMKQLLGALGERAKEVAVVFVSVDPHRDTLEKMAEYVPGFDERFYGVRLEHHELDTVKEAWDLTVQYGQPKDGPGTDTYYYVDHTGTYFVVDQDGRLRLEFPPNATVEDLEPDLVTLLDT
jgi:protein SCO1/2